MSSGLLIFMILQSDIYYLYAYNACPTVRLTNVQNMKVYMYSVCTMRMIRMYIVCHTTVHHTKECTVHCTCTTQPITVVIAAAMKVKRHHKTLTIDKLVTETTRQAGRHICVAQLPLQIMEWVWLTFNTTTPIFLQSGQIH